MKHLVLFILAALAFNSCRPKTPEEIQTEERFKGTTVIVIDSCEYINDLYMLAHKGNCRFCAERRRKALEEYWRNNK